MAEMATMTILRETLVAAVGAVVGAAVCAVVFKLWSGEFRPELACAIGGPAGFASMIATSSRWKKRES